MQLWKLMGLAGCMQAMSLAALGQSIDANVRIGLDAVAGLQVSDYGPVNEILVRNGYNGVRSNSARFGIGVALCGPLTGKLPVRLGFQAMMNTNENLSGNSRTSLTGLNTQLNLELDVVNKGAFIAGPLIGIGVLTSTIEASKDNQVGGFNSYVAGNAKGITLHHLTFPLNMGGRVWLRMRNNAAQQLKRQGFFLAGGYMLGLDGQNWHWANNVSLPNGPSLNAGGWYVQLGFGAR
ncbi:hypothetical protein [Fibrella aquatilis]|uniref:Outer membrane protein beta-barrel domain-containing protein n=1 Tax=Fibrella aquatilis TaxID=2817059 RepID=A0A939G0K9_9BACT|nr:hypothetical protein [Fibrella aquatilis]MBO0930192.1 hypothetical protein [Fibrella aquatilis]